VRQRERLRRALTTAADFLGWSTLDQDRVEIAIHEFQTLANAGARSAGEELEQQLTDKRSEMPRLRKAAEALQTLTDEEELETPVEFSYIHTARKGDELVTKTEIVTIGGQEEAVAAAAAIEKKFDSYEKLRLQMVEELKLQRRRVEEMSESLSDFANSQRGLVQEVFAVLH
jgi:hypothetical protein